MTAKTVEFIGISIWDQEDDVCWRTSDEYNVPYPNGIDGDGQIAIDYGVTGIPEKFFIDRDGRVVKRFAGPMNASRLRSILDELLADNTTKAAK